jgi:Ca-activated chloride channel family protein
MRWILGALSALLVGSLFSDGSAAAQETWVGGSPYQAQIRVDANGDTWVGIWVDAPAIAPQVRARAPMAVSLVIDTSGSMAGDKIDNARMAVSSLLETLGDGDIVSIYGFSNGVMEIAPPTVLSQASRAPLMQSVSRIVAAGGTNMWDGMQVGIARMAQAPASHAVRRIFLISDGHANIGPSDPVSLGNLAAGSTENGTQITAIGVGYDYDQTTLAALAVRSSGRVYHLGQSHQMAGILEQELDMLSRSVAVNAFIEVHPAPGVTILEGATSGAVIENGRLRFPLGAVAAGQQREILFRARVNTARLGARQLATARLVYETPDERARREQSVHLAYEVTRDQAAPARTVAPRVAAMVADHEAVAAQRQAAALMQQGQAREAAVVLRRAEASVQQQAQAAPPAARARMQERAGSLGRASSAAGAARSAPEMRQRSYDFADEAMSAEGY